MSLDSNPHLNPKVRLVNRIKMHINIQIKTSLIRTINISNRDLHKIHLMLFLISYLVVLEVSQLYLAFHLNQIIKDSMLDQVLKCKEFKFMWDLIYLEKPQLNHLKHHLSSHLRVKEPLLLSIRNHQVNNHIDI